MHARRLLVLFNPQLFGGTNSESRPTQLNLTTNEVLFALSAASANEFDESSIVGRSFRPLMSCSTPVRLVMELMLEEAEPPLPSSPHHVWQDVAIKRQEELGAASIVIEM
jgi:hypothetical protein